MSESKASFACRISGDVVAAVRIGVTAGGSLRFLAEGVATHRSAPGPGSRDRSESRRPEAPPRCRPTPAAPRPRERYAGDGDRRARTKTPLPEEQPLRPRRPGYFLGSARDPGRRRYL